MSSTAAVSLSEMVDLALGTPEIGAVNFNVLHGLLHAVLNHLNLGHFKAELPSDPDTATDEQKADASPESRPIDELDESGDESDVKDIASTEPMVKHDKEIRNKSKPSKDDVGSAREKFIPITRMPYHKLEERVGNLEKKWDELNQLPSNAELSERVRDGADAEKPRPVTEMWQNLQLARKVDANTQGVSKLMSMVEDLMKNMQELKDMNDRLCNQMADQLREKDKNNDTLNDILSRLQNLENLKASQADVDEKLKALERKIPEKTDQSVPMDDFVTWSALEDALKGLREQLDQQDKPAPPAQADQPICSIVEPVEEMKLVQDDKRELLVPPAVLRETGNQTDSLSRSASNVVQRSRVSTPGPSAELQELLERLGKLSHKHDGLEKRVDNIENVLNSKADKADLAALGVSDDLLQKLLQLSNDVRSLQDSSNKESNSLGRLEQTIHLLQSELQRLNNTTDRLLEENRSQKKNIQEALKSCEDLYQRKADKISIQPEIKVDRENEVNRKEFESMCADINRIINDMLNKLIGNEGEWKKAVEQLNNEMGDKLDRLEFGPLREELERQLRALAKRFNSQGSPGAALTEDEAAGIRKRLVQRFNCLSCDKPIGMVPQKAIPALPNYSALPGGLSMRPYTVYELDQIRQYARGVQRQGYGSDFMDAYVTSRQCGGSHTVTYPHKRFSKFSYPPTYQVAQATYDESATWAVPPASTQRDLEETTPVLNGSGLQNGTRQVTKLPSVYASANKTAASTTQTTRPPNQNGRRTDAPTGRATSALVSPRPPTTGTTDSGRRGSKGPVKSARSSRAEGELEMAGDVGESTFQRPRTSDALKANSVSSQTSTPKNAVSPSKDIIEQVPATPREVQLDEFSTDTVALLKEPEISTAIQPQIDDEIIQPKMDDENHFDANDDDVISPPRDALSPPEESVNGLNGDELSSDDR